MTDTEILDWIERNASKLGMKPDWTGLDTETLELRFEFTDIRQRVLKAAQREAPNIADVGHPPKNYK